MPCEKCDSHLERIKGLEEDKGDWVEMINELKSFKKEKEELRTLVIGLGRALKSAIKACHGCGVLKNMEQALLLIPEELRKEIEKV